MFRQSVDAGELDSLSVPAGTSSPTTDDYLEERLTLWRKNPSDVGLMAEALSHSMLLRREDLIAEILGKSKGVIVPPKLGGMLESARDLIASEHAEDASPITHFSREQLQAFIHLHRRTSRISPYDAIGQIEMAWNYLVIGRMDKAERCIKWALTVAPHNRYVLRSACRFYIHRSEHDRAKRLLQKSGLTRTDPWIAAALVSVEQALKQAPAQIKPLQELGQNKGISPLARSELLAALGDFHFGEGDRKRSKKLFTEALQQPTDNALAQAVNWISVDAHEEAGKMVQLAHVKAPYEAEALVHYYNTDWDECLKQVANWRADQPFSGRPYIFQSFLLAVMKDDSKAALQVLEAGMVVDPHDPTLKNNKVFSLLNLGRTEEANAVLATIDSDGLNPEAKIADTATRGLYRYRTAKSAKDIEEARDLYSKAIALARKTPALKFRAQTAGMFQLLEEVRLGCKLHPKDIQTVNEIAAKGRDPGAVFLAKRVQAASKSAKAIIEALANTLLLSGEADPQAKSPLIELP
jgi:tetratricopeptide (TPR) repeat protein